MSDLFVAGTLRKPSFWESTAIPELRSQAAAVAERVSDLLIPRLPDSPARIEAPFDPDRWAAMALSEAGGI
jgi:uncharacterized NAD(P)/FAD-binding protein YdhS